MWGRFIIHNCSIFTITNFPRYKFFCRIFLPKKYFYYLLLFLSYYYYYYYYYYLGNNFWVKIIWQNKLFLSQEYITYSASVVYDPLKHPSYMDVLICLFLIAFPYEHILSVIGVTTLRRYDISVSYYDIPVFNDCDRVNPKRTEKSKLMFLVMFGVLVIAMISLGEL